MTTSKILMNSVLSTKDAKFMTLDIKNMYLQTDLDKYEYLRIRESLLTDEIITLYNLKNKIQNGWIFCEIRKGMYGLPQAGMLAHHKLAQILTNADFYCAPRTPGLWLHKTRPIQFTLVVDDFGVKYVGRQHAEYLLQTLHASHYKTTEDWSGSLFCGVSIQWDYVKRKCRLSMPNYVRMVLSRFHHHTPKTKEDSPAEHVPPKYGAKIQSPLPPDTSKPLSKKGITRIQQAVGCLFFYALAVDPTMLVALSDLATAQSKSTKNTNLALNKLFNYAASRLI